MKKMENTKIALLFALVMTGVVTVLRVLLIPHTHNIHTGLFHVNYVVVAVMLLAAIGVFALLLTDKRPMKELPTVKGKWLLPIAILMMLIGVCVLVVSVIDVYRWAANGIAPPPASSVIGTMDKVTLFLSLAFGVVAGVYFLRVGFFWTADNGEIRGMMPILALCPTFWVWMRLARYEISYASAVQIHESFYDFAMLLCSMLFLFALARTMAGVKATKPVFTLGFALCTMIMSVSGPVARVAFYLMGEGDAYRAGQLAGIPDFAIGVLAATLSIYWVLASGCETEKSES